MFSFRRRGQFAWIWLSIIVLLLDRASKMYISSHFVLYQQQDVIPGFFSWTLAYNSGAAFSFLAGASGWQRWLFTLIAVVVSVVLMVWLKRLRSNETWVAVALTLILGGALGNMYDRIVYGHVIDFILLHWNTQWYFPAFNVADSAITVGAVLLLFDLLIVSKSKKKF